ncbi:MAG: hypothetical protein U0974_06765 [Gemmatimonadales bacterium]|nr:hypothetical protein [Gemmatimonadales bacterium]MDZ4389415.1 hypothetical protein [Gemmatimonadales bacterium]
MWKIRALCAGLALGWLTGCGTRPSGERRASVDAAALQPGQDVAPFRVIAALTGDTLVIGGGDESGSLLMYASTTCVACDISLPFWHRLVESHGTRFRMVRFFLPTEDMARMTEARRPNETIARIAQPEVTGTQSRLHLDMTPTFILVAPGGRMSRIIVGRLTSFRVEQLRLAMDSLSGARAAR